MSRNQSRSRKRKFVGSAEMLEDRLVLNAGVPAPATPLPASSPFGVAQVRKFERALDRVDHGFMANSKHLKTFVINRTDYLQSVVARVAARAQVQVQHVSAEASASSSVGLASRAQALNNQLNQIVASFNTRVTQLSNGFEQEFGILAKPLSTLSMRLGVPANAIRKQLRARPGRSHKRCQLPHVNSPEPDKRCNQSDQHCEQLEQCNLHVDNDWSHDHISDNRNRHHQHANLQ